jgi:hypothetical protein
MVSRHTRLYNPSPAPRLPRRALLAWRYPISRQERRRGFAADDESRRARSTRQIPRFLTAVRILRAPPGLPKALAELPALATHCCAMDGSSTCSIRRAESWASRFTSQSSLESALSADCREVFRESARGRAYSTASADTSHACNLSAHRPSFGWMAVLRRDFSGWVGFPKRC